MEISLGLHLSFTSPAYRGAMTKKRLLNTLGACGALFLAFGVACLFMFKSIGSTLDEQGVLHEPFPLLPIGWLFILGGIGSLLVYGIARIVHALMSRRINTRRESVGDAKRN